MRRATTLIGLAIITIVSLVALAEPAEAARFRFEGRDGTIVWDGDNDVVTSNRLTEFPHFTDRTAADLGLVDPATLSFRLDVQVFDGFEYLLTDYPAEFPNGFRPFEVNYLQLILSLNTNSGLACVSCLDLDDVLHPDVSDLDLGDGPGFDVDLHANVVAFAGLLGPAGPAGDGHVLTLDPQFHQAFQNAIATYGADNLIVGFSGSFVQNCDPEGDVTQCREEVTLDTGDVPEPATLALLALAAVGRRVVPRRRGYQGGIAAETP
jgi:hypothetical protein